MSGFMVNGQDTENCLGAMIPGAENLLDHCLWKHVTLIVRSGLNSGDETASLLSKGVTNEPDT